MVVTAEQIAHVQEWTVEMERQIRVYLTVEIDPRRQRAALGIYRHAHALRLALEQWQSLQGD